MRKTALVLSLFLLLTGCSSKSSNSLSDIAYDGLPKEIRNESFSTAVQKVITSFSESGKYNEIQLSVGSVNAELGESVRTYETSGDITLVIYEFESNEDASLKLAEVSEQEAASGQAADKKQAEARILPLHVYIVDNVIISYSGDDQEVIQILSDASANK